VSGVELLIVNVSVPLNTLLLIVLAFVQRRSRNALKAGQENLGDKISEVHDEVKTGNSHTAGQLLDIAQGRAIEAATERDDDAVS
jgi:hypothetical protein